MGIVLPDKNVVFVRAGKVVEMTIEQIALLPFVISAAKPAGLTEKLAAFFQHHRRRARIVALGLNALELKNYRVFDSLDIMPELGAPRSQAEYDAAWHRVMSKLQRGDSVFVFEHRRPVDWTIAWLDHGSWSHYATYSGSGRIIESVPGKGIVERSIEVYRNRYVRLGVYRLNVAPDAIEKAIEALRGRLGAGYNYRGALRLGLKKLFLRVRFGNSAHYIETDATPNDLIYSGVMWLVDYV